MYRFSSAPSRPSGPTTLALADGRVVELAIRQSARARRVALRLPASGGKVELVVPPGARLATALAFLEARKPWIESRLRAAAPVRPFVADAVIPVLGTERRLVALGPVRGAPPFRLTQTEIEVSGRPEHLARRTRDGLRSLALETLTARTLTVAARIGRTVADIRIQDARTRWGSCSPTGIVRYSWRLILAPAFVLDYVVAHEVAHLVEHNHSPGFWRVVASLGVEIDAAHAWTRRHGAELHLYG